MTYAISLAAGILIGALLAYLACRPALVRGARQEEALKNELAAKNETLIALNRETAEMQARRDALEERLAKQEQESLRREELRRQEETARQEREARAEAARREEAARQAAAAEERQRAEFRNLANEILEEKSRQFRQTNRESLELLLKPFRDNIEGFRKKVEEVYDKEAQQRFSLKEEVRRLNEMNKRMSDEANNLTRALKGDSKIQGDWGEMILETILDSSHLIKGIHYRTQENLKDESGANLRPDVILNLPEGKQVVIDSKVSLTAYAAYAESETPEKRSKALKDHLRSVRAHIDELGSKRYQTLVDSPDFVIMFVPNEPAFLLAMQEDNSLWGDAYNKKVIVSSPTNLFALLKIVDDLWKRDSQSKNAIAIATEGANLYDKFAGFAETLADIGKNIEAAGRNYEKAMGQLKTGRGNLLARTAKLRELGVKATKNLPPQLADYDEEPYKTSDKTL